MGGAARRGRCRVLDAKKQVGDSHALGAFLSSRQAVEK